MWLFVNRRGYWRLSNHVEMRPEPLPMWFIIFFQNVLIDTRVTRNSTGGPDNVNKTLIFGPPHLLPRIGGCRADHT